MTRVIVSFEHDDAAKSWLHDPRVRVVLAAILLSLMAHVLGVTVLPPILDLLSRSTAKPIEVKTIDPNQIDSIKDAWKERERLLIDPSARESEVTAPENARYASDRNQTVQKETQARKTAPVPRARPRQAQQKLRLPNLRDLGVRLPSPLGIPMAARPQTAQAEARDTTTDPAQDWGGQELLDDKVEYGEENVLNTRESIYYSFYARIYEQISPVWRSQIREAALARHIPEGRYESVVDVVLDSEGNFVEVRWMQSSGYEELDRAVERAWAKVGKFRNPPQGLLEADGRVHMPWSFTFDSSQRGRFLPPTRLSR